MILRECFCCQAVLILLTITLCLHLYWGMDQYTVHQLAELAGVTPRTLRYYDEINLLKPAFIGQNGYRYYQMAEILRLQQILILRKMDLPLTQIQVYLDRGDFDQVKALRDHKKKLRSKIDQYMKIIDTMDSTIQLLERRKEFSAETMFNGLSDENQAQYAREAAEVWDSETVTASQDRWAGYSRELKDEILAEGRKIYEDFSSLLSQSPASKPVQAVVARWHKHIEYFWNPEISQLTELAKVYVQDSRFKAYFDQLNENLAGFIFSAVQIYAESYSSRCE